MILNIGTDRWDDDNGDDDDQNDDGDQYDDGDLDDHDQDDDRDSDDDQLEHCHERNCLCSGAKL